MMKDDVPLICDTPPGGLLVITSDARLSRDTMERLRMHVDEGLRTGVLILDSGFHIQQIPGREWPDAEFCAA